MYAIKNENHSPSEDNLKTLMVLTCSGKRLCGLLWLCFDCKHSHPFIVTVFINTFPWICICVSSINLPYDCKLHILFPMLSRWWEILLLNHGAHRVTLFTEVIFTESLLHAEAGWVTSVALEPFLTEIFCFGEYDLYHSCFFSEITVPMFMAVMLTKKIENHLFW